MDDVHAGGSCHSRTPSLGKPLSFQKGQSLQLALPAEADSKKEHKVKSLNCDTVIGIDPWGKNETCPQAMPKFSGDYPVLTGNLS